MWINYKNITLEPLITRWIPGNMQAAILRLDKLHPEVSGNKWFKLKHNIEIAIANNKKGIITYGGAYSNHIAATALACKESGLSCLGIIRGQEQYQHLNHTLEWAATNGMELMFVTRDDYRNKNMHSKWEMQYPEYHTIPEGGHNLPGAQGCEEILSIFSTTAFTHILCAVGTGTTLAGLINSACSSQHVTGIATLKGAQYLEQEVADLLHPGHTSHWQILHEHHCGGYAKKTPQLIDFMNTFYSETHIPTDIIYTGKLLYAFYQITQQGYFPANSKVLLIHSGGLQGNLSLPPGVLWF